ncbi:MAG: HU family DNA-binding protein [Firmicutes bacterium]|nr:HU family DNA-binding protein [Bacillota bacterium]
MSGKINTPDIIDEVSRRMGCTKKDCKELLEHFVDVITENLRAGLKVNYCHLGIFYLCSKNSSARRIFKATVKFRPSKKLIKKINNKGGFAK